VLVGRGGVSIAHNIADSLHIRLIAPFYWRVENVMKKKQMDIEKAEEYVVDTDEKRHNLITTFLEKKSVNIDYLFDATINRQSFSINDIAEIIVSMYERKIGRQMPEQTQNKQIF
jgi:cytidylate kinase